MHSSTFSTTSQMPVWMGAILQFLPLTAWHHNFHKLKNLFSILLPCNQQQNPYFPKSRHLQNYHEIVLNFKFPGTRILIIQPPLQVTLVVCFCWLVKTWHNFLGLMVSLEIMGIMYWSSTHLILGHNIPGAFCVFMKNNHWAVSHSIKIEMTALEATESRY